MVFTNAAFYFSKLPQAPTSLSPHPSLLLPTWACCTQRPAHLRQPQVEHSTHAQPVAKPRPPYPLPVSHPRSTHSDADVPPVSSFAPTIGPQRRPTRCMCRTYDQLTGTPHPPTTNFRPPASAIGVLCRFVIRDSILPLLWNLDMVCDSILPLAFMRYYCLVQNWIPQNQY